MRLVLPMFITNDAIKSCYLSTTGMTGEACACGPTPARLLPEPEPDHLYDHHSSEEELEVIALNTSKLF